MSKYQNIAIKISNYATSALNDLLLQYGENGFELVNSLIAKNEYGVDVMYCFFTKQLKEEN